MGGRWCLPEPQLRDVLEDRERLIMGGGGWFGNRAVKSMVKIGR